VTIERVEIDEIGDQQPAIGESVAAVERPVEQRLIAVGGP
jgi:hypothetical protein